jgi:hypothetical protein
MLNNRYTLKDLRNKYSQLKTDSTHENDSAIRTLLKLIEEFPVFKSNDDYWDRFKDTVRVYLGKQYADTLPGQYYGTWPAQAKRLVDSIRLIEAIRVDSIVSLLNIIPINQWPILVYDKLIKPRGEGAGFCLINSTIDQEIDSSIINDMIIYTEKGGELNKTITRTMGLKKGILTINGDQILLNNYYKRKLDNLTERIKNYREEISEAHFVFDGWDYEIIYKSSAEKKAYKIVSNTSGDYRNFCSIHNDLDVLLCEMYPGDCFRLMNFIKQYHDCDHINSRAQQTFNENFLKHKNETKDTVKTH